MAVSYDSVIKALNGSIDGVNKTFTTDTPFVSGILRVIVNGQVYESDDDGYGWSEIDESTIQMDVAPLESDLLQAFYQDKDSEHVSLENVLGSPFDPNGVLP